MRIKYCEASKLNQAPRIELKEIYSLLVYLLLIKQAIRQKAVTQQSSLKIMFCKTHKFHKKASGMESHFNKAVSPRTINCTKKDIAYYTYFKIFALCFVSIEPCIFEFKFFGFRTDQYLFNSPSYFNSQMLKFFNKEKVNKKSMCKYLT